MKFFNGFALQATDRHISRGLTTAQAFVSDGDCSPLSILMMDYNQMLCEDCRQPNLKQVNERALECETYSAFYSNKSKKVSSCSGDVVTVGQRTTYHQSFVG